MGYPTLYFIPSNGEDILLYEGARTAEEMINFINKNREIKAGASAAVEEVTKTDAVEEEVTSSSASIKDEL